MKVLIESSQCFVYHSGILRLTKRWMLFVAHLRFVRRPLVICAFKLLNIRFIPLCETGGAALSAVTAVVSFVLTFHFHRQRRVVAMLSSPFTTL